MAVHDFGAKMMTLDTISNEDVTVDSPRRIALKRPILKVSYSLSLKYPYKLPRSPLFPLDITKLFYE